MSFNYKYIFDWSVEKSKRDYPFLLDIIICPPRFYDSPTQQRIDYFKPGWKQCYWDVVAESYSAATHKPRSDTFGGHAVLVSKQSELRGLVFLKQPPKTNNYDGYALLYLTLSHELGHIDDMSKSINIQINRPVDMCAAEYHAHIFAGRRIMMDSEAIASSSLLNSVPPALVQENLPVIFRGLLKVYMESWLKPQLMSEFEYAALAAQKVIASNEYRDLLDWQESNKQN